MAKAKTHRDPRGHSLRVYADVYDSPAFAALSPYDVVAYLALLRELKGYNNGDLSLPLSRARECGISHPKTLARSLRALCAVGLVAVTRKGGCTKGGQRQPTLYRLTDRECYAMPAKHLEAMAETNEWKCVASVQKGEDLIAAVEDAARKMPENLKSLGHGVTVTMASGAMVKAKTRAPREPWNEEPGHRVNMAEKAANPMPMRVAAGFRPDGEKPIHRAPRSTPLYIYQSKGHDAAIHGHGSHERLTRRPAHLFTGLLNRQPVRTH